MPAEYRDLPRSAFRVVQSDPPTAWDLTSSASRGRRIRQPGSRAEDLSRGISVFATEEQAVEQARRYPHLGRYVAEIRVVPDARLERTGSRIGHYTLWTEPEILLGSVVRVIRVE